MTTFCPECRDEREFSPVPCLDEHADCPERACVDCGYAVMVGWLAVDVAPPPRARRSVAA